MLSKLDEIRHVKIFFLPLCLIFVAKSKKLVVNKKIEFNIYNNWIIFKISQNQNWKTITILFINLKVAYKSVFFYRLVIKRILKKIFPQYFYLFEFKFAIRNLRILWGKKIIKNNMFVILIILNKNGEIKKKKKTWKMESCICLFNFLSFDVNHFGIHTPKLCKKKMQQIFYVDRKYAS